MMSLDVAARAERAPGAGDHDGADGVASCAARERVGQLAVGVEGERVQALGPVEPDRGDAVVLGVAEVLGRSWPDGTSATRRGRLDLDQRAVLEQAGHLRPATSPGSAARDLAPARADRRAVVAEVLLLVRDVDRHAHDVLGPAAGRAHDRDDVPQRLRELRREVARADELRCCASHAIWPATKSRRAGAGRRARRRCSPSAAASRRARSARSSRSLHRSRPARLLRRQDGPCPPTSSTIAPLRSPRQQLASTTSATSSTLTSVPPGFCDARKRARVLRRSARSSSRCARPISSRHRRIDVVRADEVHRRRRLRASSSAARLGCSRRARACWRRTPPRRRSPSAPPSEATFDDAPVARARASPARAPRSSRRGPWKLTRRWLLVRCRRRSRVRGRGTARVSAIPALLTSQSIGPCPARAPRPARRPASSVAGSLTSTYERPGRPVLRRGSRSRPRRRPPGCAPRRSRRRPRARDAARSPSPMPRPAPVTRATCRGGMPESLPGVRSMFQTRSGRWPRPPGRRER